jgi:hypothetical protein
MIDSLNGWALFQEEWRDERVQHQLQALGSRVDAKLEAMDSKIDKRFEAMDSKIDKLSNIMEKRLEKIAEAVGVNKTVNEGDDDEDRKRLKERLNEALKTHKKKVLKKEIHDDGWAEYLFGICKPNGRLGKHGSRFIEPTFVLKPIFFIFVCQNVLN